MDVIYNQNSDDDDVKCVCVFIIYIMYIENSMIYIYIYTRIYVCMFVRLSFHAGGALTLKLDKTN
jgi:hypothetical protein